MVKWEEGRVVGGGLVQGRGREEGGCGEDEVLHIWREGVRGELARET